MTGKTKSPRQPRPKQGSSAAEVPHDEGVRLHRRHQRLRAWWLSSPRTAASCSRRSST